jgi:MoxR-like ATPase
VGDWLIYGGTGEPHDGISRLPGPPVWRTFDRTAAVPRPGDESAWSTADVIRATSYRPPVELLNPVNAALYLRRPLLVTGKPGVGKSTLAYSVAYELGLGPVLRWTITSRSTLQEGIYQYDPLSRLHDINLTIAGGGEIGRYLRLGPLGTALLPTQTPRVLLIDEIDKADLDLPNDMLTVFEEGEYEIPELVRMADAHPVVAITSADGSVPVEVRNGRVRCLQFPLVIMTSNGEREFPAAFLRRCLRVNIGQPGLDQLTAIVEAQLGPELTATAGSLIRVFHQRAQEGDLAIDQLLNAIHLSCHAALDDRDEGDLLDLVLRHLNGQLE